MTDFLLELGQNPQARKLVKSLRLPIPIPQPLRRARGPWEERPLADANVLISGGRGDVLSRAIAETLIQAGANPHLVGEPDLLAVYRAPSDSFARPVRVLEPDAAADLSADALVFDATKLSTVADLSALYRFFHPMVGTLRHCGRAVVVGRPPAGPTEAASVQAALDGFVRSLGKELGRYGSTANLVYVDAGAEDRLAGVLRFLLSPRSAFVSGQPLRVTSVAHSSAAVPWVKPLEGKVAVVTGAARGIGNATSRLLADEGAHVVCLDRPADDGPTSQLAREIGGSVFLCDVSDPGAGQALAEDLQARFGGVDVIVHNAGITRDKTVARMSRESWDQVTEINLGAVLRITDELLKGTLRDNGRIVCLSSVSGIAGNVGQTNYAASKAGIVGFVRSLAPVVGSRGITVNAIAPGFIETRLTAAIPFVIREAARRMSSLGQGGQPRDVGDVITFLSTPGALGLTGQVLRVCGGALVGA
jgi:3-oxoacyl-[acyl-carrier protein] reductase